MNVIEKLKLGVTTTSAEETRQLAEQLALELPPTVTLALHGDLGVGKTTLTFSVSVNVLSANFPFCVVPAGGEGGVNGKYVDVSGKR